MWSRPTTTDALFALALAACGGAAPAPSVPDVTPVRIDAPPDATLETACTPTGPEQCFNAIDDNCNGVIDEGCGEETGVLQFTIAWGGSPADVNLVVVTPASERVPNDHT